MVMSVMKIHMLIRRRHIGTKGQFIFPFFTHPLLKTQLFRSPFTEKIIRGYFCSATPRESFFAEALEP